jgi:hypothetical protein
MEYIFGQLKIRNKSDYIHLTNVGVSIKFAGHTSVLGGIPGYKCYIRACESNNMEFQCHDPKPNECIRMWLKKIIFLKS